MIDLPMAQIVEFCDRWQVVEFSPFGSILREDFRPDRDVPDRDINVCSAVSLRRDSLAVDACRSHKTSFRHDSSSVARYCTD